MVNHQHVNLYLTLIVLSLPASVQDTDRTDSLAVKPRQKKDFELLACFIAVQSGLSLILCFCCNSRNYFSLEVLTLYLMVTECHIRFNLLLCHFLSCKMNPMRLNSLIKVFCHNSRWLPFLTTNTLYLFVSGTG